MITSEKDIRCLEHECTDCGKKLQTKMGKFDYIFMIGFAIFFVIIIGLGTWFDNKLNNVVFCQVRTLQGDTTIVKPVDCPK